MTGPFTGRHMAAVMICGFGVVMAVNFVMASYAISTFGGVVVENSYVASQKFNGWLDEAARARELGWDVGVERGDAGHILITTVNVPKGAEVSAVARHPLGVEDDHLLHFTSAGDSRFVSRENLPDGRWTVRLAVRAAGRTWHAERAVR